MVAVVAERLGVPRLDDERAVEPALFLERRVAVIPVRAALADPEAVDERLTGPNPVEAQPRYAVHVGGQQDAVPVNGRLVAQPVGHPHRDRVAFTARR